MADINLTAADMRAVPVDGYINEDLMQEIFDVSPVDLPFTDSISKGTSSNFKKDWVRESLAAASPDNARVDGSDSTGDDTAVGERLSNYHQIMSKIVKVSDRGQEVDSVGSSDELIRQIMKRGKEIRRDCEAALVSRNVAVAGDGDAVAGKLAGIGGWIGVKVLDVASTTSDRGATTGADPVLSNDGSGGGGHPTTAAVAGTKRALSESSIKSMMQAAYLNGGEPTMAMSTPSGIQVLSDYLFTSSARVATLQTDASASNRVDNSSGGGTASGGITAQGSVNVLVTNFGTLSLVPNRFQPEVGAAVADMYLIDPDSWEISFLQGYETKELARTGIADNREITCDVTLCATNPEANAVVADIDTALAATE